jgi:hypothetical protein
MLKGMNISFLQIQRQRNAWQQDPTPASTIQKNILERNGGEFNDRIIIFKIFCFQF